MEAGTAMPDWSQLGSILGADLTDFVPHDAIDAISAYEEEHGRVRMIERMGQLLHIDAAAPGRAHQALCSVGFDLVLTTNFDFLLERAYDAIGQPCQPLLVEAQLSQRPLDGQAQLLKLHGDLNHPDQLVATERDFDSFLTRRPLMATFTANLLITRTPVLFGYSFDDPDTRSLWALIRDRLGSLQRKGYVFLVKPSPTEIARFARRNIAVVDLPGNDYGSLFADLFDELRSSYNEKLGTVSRPTEDEVAAELTLPLSAMSRLCFLSAPARLMPWYRSEIFPIIEAAGYVTVTPEDVVPPGANAAATMNALLTRSSLAVIDASSFSTSFELGMALSAVPSERVIAIFGTSHAPALDPAQMRRVHILHRGDDPGDDAFIEALKECLTRC
jgi:hypothetical protein